ncbi:MAG: sulfurtransferase complex subunit TusB [Candidatus Thorarchaeota archaeon]
MGNNFIVYLYGFSTILDDKLDTLIEIIEIQIEQDNQIKIVFIHDGVIGTSQKHIVSHSMEKLLKLPITFYSLIPDLEARGIETNKLWNKIKGINYEELVDILVNTPKIVSWI